MGLWGGIKSIGKGAWKILDPLTPDEYVGAAGSALKGDWGQAKGKLGTALKDAVRGAAVGLGGAGLAGVGPAAGLLGGVGGTAGGVIKGVGGAALGAGKAIGNAALSPYGQMAMYGGGINPLGMVLGGIDAVSNARDATRYRGIEDEQIAYAKAQQARKQQFEDQVMGNLNKPLNVPNLTNVFEDTSNPFYKPFTSSPAIQGVSTAMPPISQQPPTQLPIQGTGGGGLAGFQMPLTRGGMPQATEDQKAQANRVMAFLRPQGGGGMQVRARSM